MFRQDRARANQVSDTFSVDIGAPGLHDLYILCSGRREPRPRKNFDLILPLTRELQTGQAAGHWDRRGIPGRRWRELRSITASYTAFFVLFLGPFSMRHKPTGVSFVCNDTVLQSGHCTSTGSAP